MYFTQEDYLKIQQWLQRNSVKDTEFQEANVPLAGNEIITVTQNGHNRKVYLKDLVNQIFSLGVTDFVNVSALCDEYNITLSDAIKLVPHKSRKRGQVITFLNTENNWEIQQFNGVKNQWNVLDCWKSLFNWQDILNISFEADEEDITSNISEDEDKIKLSFKERVYDPDIYSGLGYKILRKNLVKYTDPALGEMSKNILTPDKISHPNTIYEIRYDFDLNNQTIRIPEGCVLQYKGGSLNNGTLIYEDTIIEGVERLSNVNIEGNYKYPYTGDESNPDTQLAPTMTQFRKLNTQVNNIADDEDLTKIYDDEKGQEVLQLKNRQYIQGSNNGMGYVILRKNNSFKEQLIQFNTIYEIRYDFDLGGKEVEIPENCVLKFDGGKLTNGTIIGNSTRVIGDPTLGVRVNGNWVTNFYASWVDKGNSKYSSIIKSILSVSNPFVLDCDITLDGSSVTLDKLIIQGSNKTIHNTCSFNVKSELNLSNIIFDCDSDLEHVVRVTEKGEVDINNVKIYGNSKAKHGVRTNNLSKCNITSCEVSGVINYGIRIDGKVRGAAIRNCYIHDIGNDVSVNGIRNSAIGLIVGNNDSNCAYTRIENVIVENIQCGYAEGNDSGEAHGIIVYGEHSIVSGCTISNIYTISDGEDINPGVDCEGLYTKGDYVNIENNNVIYANGASSDGAITAKTGNYVRIKGNNVKIKRGHAIVVTESNCTIEGNTIQCEKDASGGFYCYTYIGNVIYNNVIKNNYFECVNRTRGTSSFAVSSANADGIIIENNTIKNFPRIIQCYDSGEDKRDLSMLATGNIFELINQDLITEFQSEASSSIYGIIYCTVHSIFRYKIINNTFNIVGCRIGSIFFNADTVSNSNSEFIGNKINLIPYSGIDAVVSGGASRLDKAFAGVKTFSNNTIDYGTNCTISKLVFDSKGVIDTNIFSGNINVLPVLNGSKVSNNRVLLAKDSGDSSSRPTNKVSVGFLYIDTSINKPIWWTGTKWVDATGAEV